VLQPASAEGCECLGPPARAC